MSSPIKKAPLLILLSVILYSRVNAQATLPPAYPGNLVKNYTRVWTAAAPQQNSNTLMAGTLPAVTQTTQYYDGFGRPLQAVAKQASPLGNDMVAASVYDAAGREIYKYLPFTSNVAQSGDVTNDGNFKTDPFQQQVAFYNGLLSGQPGETNVGAGGTNWAYSQNNYEASPMNRVLSSYAPGANWVGSQGTGTPHGVQQQFLTNTSTDNVQIWNIAAWDITQPEQNIIPTDGGAYAAGQLAKLISADEQGHQVIQFKDSYGQIVLKKEQLTATADNGNGSAHTGWICTYYVYDDFGNLRFIITPNVVQLIDGTWSISLNLADQLCYRFEYDALNHLVVKKNPGTPSGATGEIWTVYDQRDRLVLKQDGNLRGVQKWQYLQYDNLDRPIASGFINDPSNYSNLAYHVNGAAASGNTSAGVSAWPALSSYTTELLSQSFYDNYTWMNSTNSSTLPSSVDVSSSGSGNSAFSTSYNVSPAYAQPITQSAMTRGLVTGVKMEVLGSNGSQYIYAVSFYDAKGRTIQSQSINSTGGKDISTAQFSWDGKILTGLVSHNKAGTNPQTHQLTSVMSYDVMGRLLTVAKTINSTVNGVAITPVTTTIVANQYDEEGRLQKKTLGASLESLSYDYNVRGWLLGENRNYISGASTTNYFAEELAYDKTSSSAPGNTYLHAAYNGNIGGAVWKSRGDGINRKYDFTYDNDKRLMTAAYLQNTTASAWDNSYIDFSVNGLGYDGNGNITAASQNGFLLGGSQTIDQLQYNYMNSGQDNRLLNVVDNSPYNSNTTPSILGDLHYSGAKSSTNVDYTYDADGNVLSDYNRGIAAISYYYLNLPQVITVTGKGSVTYLYDAAGNKLKKTTVESNASVNLNGTNYATSITTTTTYVGGFVYKSLAYSNSSLASLQYTDVLQYAGHEEGRIRFKPAVGAVPAGFVFDYFIRDHQGNVRMVLTDEQQQDVYPAATLETGTYNGGTAESVEGQYYSINAADIMTTATQLPWFSSATNSTYQNTNGTPANPDPYSNTTAGSANVYWLNGQTGDKTGLGITLKVMAGDQISISGKSVWHNTGTTASYVPITSTLSTFLTLFAGTPVVTGATHGLVTGTALNNTSATTSLLAPMLNGTPNQTSNTTYAPKAAINWILFDDQFRPVSGGIGTDLVNSTPDVVKTHTLLITGIPPMAQNGYIYIYCSNESNIDVYFDNLQVVQTHGPIEEETHYYPYGLAMAGISDRAWGKQLNFTHLEGNEMQNQEFNDGTGLEEYDFHARYYDQQLGVWHTQDPVSQFSSPYLAMGNNWPNGIDPNGKNFWSTLGTIGIIAASAVAAYFTAGLSFDAESQFLIAGAVAAGGYAGASLESHSWNPGKWNGDAWKGAITGELIAASASIGGEYAAGEFADLTTGSAADIASMETGFATGVGQNIVTTELGGLASTGKFSWNWNDMFVATTTGAVSGVFQSPGMQKYVDNNIWGGVSNQYYKGVTSNVIGGVISTSISGAAQKGWRGVFDISDQWPAAFGNALGQMAHQALSDDASTALFGSKFTTRLVSNYGNSFMQQAVAGINPIDITNFYTSSFWNTFQGVTMDTLFPDVY